MRRHPRAWLGVFALLLAVQISPWWYPKQDSCTYLSIARSLADGPPVTNLGRPRLAVLPGYPALLSPAFLFGSRPFLAISVLQWLLAVILMLGVYRWSKRFAPSLAVLITGLAMLNTAVWYHYRRPLKEIAFMAAAMWTVNAMHALVASGEKPPWRTAGRAACAALLVIATIAIRYTGAVLLLGYCVAAVAAARRGRISWKFAAGTTLAVGLPVTLLAVAHLRYDHIQSERHDGSPTYLQLFARALRTAVVDDSVSSARTASAGGAWGGRLIEGSRLQISNVSRVTLPGMFKAYGKPGEWLHPTMLIAFAAWGVLIVGWMRLAVRESDVLACAAPFYLVLYAIWACDQGARFAVPLVPVAMACVCLGLPRIGQRCAAQRNTILAGLFVSHLAVAVSYWLLVDAPRARQVHRDWTAIERFANTIDDADGPVAMLRGADQPGKALQKNRLMVQYTIDRPVGWVLAAGGQKRPENFRWIVSRGRFELGGNFVLAEEAGGLALYERRAGSSVANGEQTSQDRTRITKRNDRAQSR